MARAEVDGQVLDEVDDTGFGGSVGIGCNVADIGEGEATDGGGHDDPGGGSDGGAGGEEGEKSGGWASHAFHGDGEGGD